MEKKELRAIVRRLKKDLTDEMKLEQSRKVFDFIEQMPIFKQAHSVLLYHSMPDELPTHDVIKAWAKVKQVYLPRVNGDDLDILPFDSMLCDDNQFHIFEPTGDDLVPPEKLDLIIVPAIALDAQRNRMGRGKGFYDRLLNPLTKVYTIGVGFDCQFFDSIPCEPHDKRLSAVVTPQHRVIS
jgi:5-formyltetrahydrofolate cyclo-ligase